MSEMSDLGNQIVRLFALSVPIFALISRVDFSQPKYVGRLKSTLLAAYNTAKKIMSDCVHVIRRALKCTLLTHICSFFAR